MMKYVLVLVLLAAATATADDTSSETAGKEGTDVSEGTCEIDGVTYQYGENLPSDDPCKVCTCYGQPTPLCMSSFCALPECPEGYEIFRSKDICCPYCQPIP